MLTYAAPRVSRSFTTKKWRRADPLQFFLKLKKTFALQPTTKKKREM
jgi:hypothetical protein